MEHFWDTVDTIGEGFGFSLFGARHLVTGMLPEDRLPGTEPLEGKVQVQNFQFFHIN